MGAQGMVAELQSVHVYLWKPLTYPGFAAARRPCHRGDSACRESAVQDSVNGGKAAADGALPWSSLRQFQQCGAENGILMLLTQQ